MDTFIGSTMLFAGNFAPRGWALCQGQILNLRQYTALFSILGTTYGGDGVQTFGLPNLAGRQVVGAGQATGSGTNYIIGETVGTTAVTINSNQMPAHAHGVAYTATLQSSSSSSTNSAANGFYGSYESGTPYNFSPDTPTLPFPAALTTSSAGTTTPAPINYHNPYLAMSYIICLVGVFPSRN